MVCCINIGFNVLGRFGLLVAGGFDFHLWLLGGLVFVIVHRIAQARWINVNLEIEVVGPDSVWSGHLTTKGKAVSGYVCVPRILQ